MDFSRILRKYIAPSLLVGTILLGGCAKADNGQFSAFTEELFKTEISSDTLTMHYTIKDPLSYGIGEYTVSLGSPYPDGSSSELKSLKRQLSHFKGSKLYGEDALTREALSSYIDMKLALEDYRLYDEPLLPSGGIASQLLLLFAEFPFDDIQDINDYLALLPQIGDFFAELLSFEQKKAGKGLFMSDEICGKTIDQLEELIADVEDNCLLSTFDDRISHMDLTEEQKALYIEENHSILVEQVIPAYKELIRGLTGLMGSGRNELGLCYLPDGKEYYRLLVQKDTCCDDSIEDLEKQIEDARINDFAICSNLVAADPELLEIYDSYDWEFEKDEQILDALSQAMLADFPAPPDITCEISYVDPSLEEYLAPAFYITAPVDSYLDNTIYINSAAGYPDISFFTTVAHESMPGHLYQTVMSYEYGLNPLRSILEFPGYTEGWATYVELIAYHYAGLPENVAELLMRNQSATLSLYATSDIGLHYYGWDLDQLADFWKEYGVTDIATIKEIAGLILSDPGNYLKYYVGCLKFMELRQSLVDKYRDDFSVKAFHEALLRIGPAPFDVVGKHLELYYSNAFAAQTFSTSD